MKPVFARGERIFLAPLSSTGALGAYAAWPNDQETTRYMGSGRFPMSEDGLRDYIRSFEGSTTGMLLGIFTSDADVHVGNVTLQSIDWVSRRGEIGILIGDSDARGQGFGTEAVRLVVEHAFSRLDLHKVTAGYVAGNEPSARLFARLGFKVEGTLREHFLSDDGYRDYVTLGLLRSEYGREAAR